MAYRPRRRIRSTDHTCVLYVPPCGTTAVRYLSRSCAVRPQEEAVVLECMFHVKHADRSCASASERAHPLNPASSIQARNQRTQAALSSAAFLWSPDVPRRGIACSSDRPPHLGKHANKGSWQWERAGNRTNAQVGRDARPVQGPHICGSGEKPPQRADPRSTGASRAIQGTQPISAGFNVNYGARPADQHI